MTGETWQVTHNMWHMTHGGVWIFFKKSQLSSSKGLGVMMFGRSWGEASVIEWMNQLMTKVFLEQPWLHRVRKHLSLIKWVSQPFPPNLQNIITPKAWELESWNFERMFNPHHVSHVRCQVLGLRCHTSHFFYKLVGLAVTPWFWTVRN